jgi:hypothetical protein
VASAQVSSRGGAQLAPPGSDVLPRRRSRWAARKQAYMFASPALFLILVFVIFPLCYSLYLTFRNYDLAVGPTTEFVGLENYAEILEDTRFWRSWINTFTIIFPAISLQLLIGLGLALLLNRRRLSEAVTKALQKSVSPKEALDQAAEEWDKITKRRSLSKQKEFWKQQATAMKEAGVTFRPELADK